MSRILFALEWSLPFCSAVLRLQTRRVWPPTLPRFIRLWHALWKVWARPNW